MKIVLVGGGSGGHIVPLIAVAKELKKLDGNLKIISICEAGSKFGHIFEDSDVIDESYQVKAGKFRRYPEDKLLRKLTDFKTIGHNLKDTGAVLKGYSQARRLLKKIRPDGILFKGGFVGVPVGVAAGHLKIPFITHDSDTEPGLTNRIIGRWAKLHATGMPAEFYSYPSAKTVFTGTPIDNSYQPVDAENKQTLRAQLGLKNCDPVIMVTGGSQGAQTLNDSLTEIAPRLMQAHKHLGIIHNAGNANVKAVKQAYANNLLADELRRVLVVGFVEDIFRYSSAADLVVTRSSATFMAEFAAQALPCVVVPGNLAGNHQQSNARHLASKQAVVVVKDGDNENLFNEINRLLTDSLERSRLADNLHKLAKPEAARELAELVIKTFRKDV